MGFIIRRYGRILPAYSLFVSAPIPDYGTYMDMPPILYFTIFAAVLLFVFIAFFITKMPDGTKRSQKIEETEYQLPTSTNKWYELYNDAWKPSTDNQNQTPRTEQPSPPVSGVTSNLESVTAKPNEAPNPELCQTLMFESPLEQIFWN